MAIEQSGPHRVSQPSVCFAGRLGVWGFPHPARDQWRVPRGSALRQERGLVYPFVSPPVRVAGWGLGNERVAFWCCVVV